MSWESFLTGSGAASVAWVLLAVLFLWRSRRHAAEEGTVIERLQTALLSKIKDIPADDLEKIREYIREINELEERSAAGRSHPAATPESDAAATV